LIIHNLNKKKENLIKTTGNSACFVLQQREREIAQWRSMGTTKKQSAGKKYSLQKLHKYIL
jgi:hypothetical protein